MVITEIKATPPSSLSRTDLGRLKDPACALFSSFFLSVLVQTPFSGRQDTQLLAARRLWVGVKVVCLPTELPSPAIHLGSIGLVRKTHPRQL